MLKPGKFRDLRKGIDETLDIIESIIRSDVVYIEWNIKQTKSRKTWYLDTAKFNLNRDLKFLLRVRKTKDAQDYDVTLKCRHPDRYLSASYDLSSEDKDAKIKFEEDISTPFISKFSLSASFEDSNLPDLSNINDLKHIFPNLDLEIKETVLLKEVNNFEPEEITYKLGTIHFTQKRNVDLYLNFWYKTLGKKNVLPLIVEFTFNYEAKKQSGKQKNELEEFPISLVKRADKFYYLLQNQTIADPNTTKTKTEYAYSHTWS